MYTDVMVVMTKLVDDVVRVTDFPDFIVDVSTNPLKHTKYRRIHYFSTYDEGDIQDIRNKP